MSGPGRMMMVLALVGGTLGGCARETAADAACDAQVDRDPVVRDLVMKGAGSEHFQLENDDALLQARKRARLACLRTRGLAPAGGVEAPRLN